MNKLFFIIAIFLFFSCTKETTSTKKKYFDLANVVKEKISHQAKNKPFIKKMVSINGKNELIETNEINWEKELELFMQADLNKQAYYASYEKQESTTELIYTLKTNENLPVKLLKITLDSLTKQPKMIKVFMKTKNYLYESEKQLLMTLEKNKLKNYQIKGSQELFLGNKKEFSIKGEIAPKGGIKSCM